MKIDLHAMYADIGDSSAGRDNLLTHFKSSGHSHRFNRRINAYSIGQLHDCINGFAIRAVNG